MRIQFDPGSSGDLTQEGIRFLHQQAATVAGFTVSGDCTTVRQSGQGIDGGLHQPVARPVVHLCDQSETATVSLEFRAIQALRGEGHTH